MEDGLLQKKASLVGVGTFSCTEQTPRLRLRSLPRRCEILGGWKQKLGSSHKWGILWGGLATGFLFRCLPTFFSTNSVESHFHHLPAWLMSRDGQTKKLVASVAADMSASTRQRKEIQAATLLTG